VLHPFTKIAVHFRQDAIGTPKRRVIQRRLFHGSYKRTPLLADDPERAFTAYPRQKTLAWRRPVLQKIEHLGASHSSLLRKDAV
jgi:hypothetical protein